MLIISVFAAIIMLFLITNSIYSYGFDRKNLNDEEEKRRRGDFEKKLPKPELLKIKSDDELLLMGDLYYNDKCNKNFVIVIHGYGTCRKTVVGFADMYFNNMNRSVFVPDLRGHGESGGNYIGFGWQDSEDILLWIDYLRNAFGDNINILLHGVSMGAATALMTASENNKSVKGVISDCSYVSISKILSLRLKKDLKLPKFPFIYLVDLILRIKCKYSINDGNVWEEVRKIKCPTLYIHGKEDRFIPVNSVYSLYENTVAPKRIFVCPNAGHAESAIVDPEMYKRTVLNFVNYFQI